jgi:ATP-dependent DNA helicase RecQ
VALTATAAPPVRRDIVERLCVSRPREIVTGFERENIELAVHVCSSPEDQRAKVLEAVAGLEGPGLVYARTRRSAEEYAAGLRDSGTDAPDDARCLPLSDAVARGWSGHPARAG